MAQCNQLHCVRRRRTDEAVDRISNLPTDILDIILCKLPVCDAVRTSTLSHGWRYKWLFMSSLVYDPKVILDYRVTLAKLDGVARMISHFLRNHQGSVIERFGIKVSCQLSYSEICQWMGFLCQKKVKEFTLEEHDRVFFRMPPSLFTFEQLRVLHLRHCSLPVPSSFQKFNFLTDLYLQKVILSDESVERLISSCSRLERLTLLCLHGVKTVRIHGSALKCLSIDSRCTETVIENAPHLATVEIIRCSYISNPDLPPYWVSLFHCLSGLRSLKNLRLDGQLLEQWVSDIPLQSFNLENNNLVSMHWDDVVFDDAETLRLCCMLLYSFPRIERLYFSVREARGYRALAEFFAEVKHSYVPFTNLKMVTMRYSNPVGAAADFLKFVVARSPLLETTTLIREGVSNQPDKEVEKIVKKLSGSAPDVPVVFKPDRFSGGRLADRKRKFSGF
ncbi:hypothetical protein Dimus_034149 [Dionaea muscipula]